MAAVQQTLVYGWAGQNGVNPVTAQVVASGNGEDNRSLTVTGGSTVDVAIEWAAAKLMSLFVYSAGAYSLVLNPNSTSPETIVPDAGHPIVWDEGSGLAYPFHTTSVTEVRIVSEQTDDLDITIKTVLDTTL